MNITQVTQSLEILLNPEQEQVITPFVLGKPGIGKSEIVKQIRAQFKFEYLLDIRLSQHDNTDIKGIPYKNETNDMIKWLSPEFMPVEGNDQFKDTTGILFFDEFNRARPDVLQSVFEIVYDRSIGGKKILPNWKIVCAGNYGYEDGCSVNEMDSALRNRFLFLDIDDIHLDPWVEWAKENKIFSPIISFLQKNPSFLYKTETGDNAYLITPRTWHKFSSILLQTPGKERETALLLGKGIIYSAQPQFIEHLDSVKKYEPAQIFDNFSKFEDEIKQLPRADIYELIEKISLYVEDNLDKFSKKQYSNFRKFYDTCLNEDNQISVLCISKTEKFRKFVNDFFENNTDLTSTSLLQKIWKNF